MQKSLKRGVSFNFTKPQDLPLLSPYISWDYNWANNTNETSAYWFDANEMDFCPMCWNGSYSKDKIRTFVEAHPSTKYLLAFNEPNLTDQANMTPAAAAQLWPEVVALAKELNLKLVSPAMNYGTLSGYSDPIKWLDEFFSQPGVSIDDVDAIAIHCYMTSSSAVQGYVERFYKYGKPIWMTEFCAWDPVPTSYETQMTYMSAVLNFLETTPEVQRYAWFMPRMSGAVETKPYNQLLTHDSNPELTDLGRLFTLFSSFDKTAYLKTDRFIYAGEYVGLSHMSINLRPTTDETARTLAGRDGLKVISFQGEQSLTYQISSSSAMSEITIRHCGYSNCILEIQIDGKNWNFVDLPRTGDNLTFADATVSGIIPAGNHTLTLHLMSGSCDLSGFMLK